MGEIVEFDRAQWLEERRTGIGSSDAAAVCGLSPWRTPLVVYLEKLGMTESHDKEEDDPAYWGKVLEPIVIAEYERRSDAKVISKQEFCRSAEHPFAIATLDGIAVFSNGGPRIVEAKTTQNFKEWGERGSDSVPLQYIFQVQHQMMVTGMQLCDIAVLIRGNDFRIYTVQRDEVIIAAMLDAERAFWQCVETRTPPAPRTNSDVLILYPKPQPGRMVEADQGIYNAYVDYHELSDEADVIGTKLEGLQVVMKAFMEDAELLTFQGDTLASWKKNKDGVRIDAKKLKKGYPDVFDDVTKPRPGPRVFLCKDPK